MRKREIATRKQQGWKHRLAKVVELPLMTRLMQVAVQLVVPKQRVGAAIVAIDEKERIFMLHHIFHPAAPWGLPGGWLQQGESPALGALRELREETGLTAVLGPVVQVCHHKRPSHISITYLAHLQAGTPTLSNEIIEFGWFKREQIPQPQFPNVLTAIDAALKINKTLSPTPPPLLEKSIPS